MDSRRNMSNPLTGFLQDIPSCFVLTWRVVPISFGPKLHSVTLSNHHQTFQSTWTSGECWSMTITQLSCYLLPFLGHRRLLRGSGHPRTGTRCCRCSLLRVLQCLKRSWWAWATGGWSDCFDSPCRVWDWQEVQVASRPTRQAMLTYMWPFNETVSLDIAVSKAARLRTGTMLLLFP